ncbi:MAG: sigma 54-interacting transcriptional regulator [Deltaproteobacteria bacterium]|nr:sigma 54-interacting transcriptional regulator [Deltaproteobacteria bacterium]
MQWDTATRYKLLLRLNNDIVSASTRHDVFSAIAQSLEDIFRFDRLSINLFDEKTNSLSYFAAAEGISPTEISEDARPLAKGAIASAVIRSREPFILSDLSTHTYWQSVNAMKEAGLNATMAFPLIVRDKVKGTLHLSYAKAPEHLEEMIEFLSEVSSRIAIAVDHMMTHTRLKHINAQLRRQKEFLTSQTIISEDFSEFIYESQVMARVVRQAKMVANEDVSVSITGETGTGKDLIAQFIHQMSNRKDALFVKVNCPSLNSSLFESELFGHAKGSFTGAHTNRVGRFEMADKGTVFLDEIGALDINLQAKLLQVLQDRTIERVGESRPKTIDFRLLSATNKDLEQAMQNNSFRSDLYYRLNTVTIKVPPLRERPEDIPVLMEKLAARQSAERNLPPPLFSESCRKVMLQYPWPGNVRELKNVIKRLIILRPGETITGNEIDTQLSGIRTSTRRKHMTLKELERQHIVSILKDKGGVVGGANGAAALLGVPRQTLQYRMRKYGISVNKLETLSV